MLRLLAAIVTFLQSAPASTGTVLEQVQCPSRIEVAQKVTSTYGNWEPFDTETQLPLVFIQITEGQPSNRIILKPDRMSGKTAMWQLPPSEEGYWVSCGYNNTSIGLAAKLPDDIKSCQVDYDTQFRPPVATRFLCK